MPKKFNKKNAVTFQLVHRSQHDPLVADESAPQRVLVPVNKQNEKQTSSTETQKEGVHKYRVRFDHDFEYLKNLTDARSLDTKGTTELSDAALEQNDEKITLPSSVFESNVEEKIGLLNKAVASTGLNLNLDSDVVAALDDDFDFDDPSNQLEDNFIELANQQLPIGEGDEEYDEEYDEEFDDDFDEDFDGETYYGDNVQFESPQCPFAKEETKSRFTEYSITSSVMKRNEQLTMLDDKFEKLYANYDEDVLGSLDCEEIEGNIGINSERLLQISNKYNEEHEVGSIAELMKDKMNLKREREDSLSIASDDEPKNAVTILCDKNKWDCESILGLYNNKDNLPKTISERKNPQTIKINAKTGIPMDTDQCLRNIRAANLPPEIRSALPKIKNSQQTSNKTVYSRPKNETPEERKQRKQLIKEERKERRKERKINLLAFKEEEKKQKKIILNKNQNIQGNRIL